MSEYFLKTDPALPRAIAEGALDSFLRALEETTPELMTALNGRPLEALRAVVEEYERVSSHKFGTITDYSGQYPALNLNPLGDLAKLICSPGMEVQKNVWPPSTTFWEPAMQGVIFRLSGAMREWAPQFLDINRNPHVRIVSVALQTMHNWIQEPESMTVPHWLGHAKVIMRHAVPTQQLSIPVNFWNPIDETEADFRERIKQIIKDLNQWSKMHIRDIKPQFVKYDTKRNTEHYHWAALRIARRMTYPKIAELWAQLKPESGDLDEGTIRKGVRAVLKLVGLRDVRAVDRK